MENSIATQPRQLQRTSHPRWRISFTLIALVILLALGGCATTVGRDYDQSKVSGFVPGQTTMSQVVSVLGQPQEKETESDGGTRLHYQYISSQSSVGSYLPGVSMFDHGVSTKGKDTFLYFNAQGKYVRAENNQSNM
jgi:outer membrane protein assembly factor BamE (lipoprotein component of BamABCDE complex)